jgi:hypothetical protein
MAYRVRRDIQTASLTVVEESPVGIVLKQNLVITISVADTDDYCLDQIALKG